MPNEYTVITGAEVHDWLQRMVTDKSQALYLCSAYIKRNVLEDIFSRLKSRQPNFFSKIRVLARWQVRDLLSKSSDLDAFEVCKAYGVKFYIKQDFHGKLYVDVPTAMLLGSANLTHRGLGVSSSSNDEANVLLPINDSVLSYLDGVFRRATLVDESLFKEMKDFIETSSTAALPEIEWPKSIAHRVELEPPERMIVDEFFHSAKPTELGFSAQELSPAALHDLSLLSLSGLEAVDQKKLIKAFLSSTAYAWLLGRLKKFNGTASFGLLTKELHDTLLDDPRPYRSTVKELLRNLISWSVVLASDRVEVFIPRHSQIVRLKT